ncbi:MAG: branched-chain-amino-acid transaminase [Candidatus Hinthialibacter antarcticus]|nr:branched-chain-amino-acid transaminase [Candidatus Hinthialibacter antarcticus]
MTIPAISINGEDRSKETATVSVFDHGFLYGDGVFEGIRISKGVIFRGERHMKRLFRSAKVIDLDPRWAPEQFLNEISRLARHWSETNQIDITQTEDPLYVRLIISRGDGDLGMDPRKCPTSKIIVIVDQIKLYPKEYYEDGLMLITSAFRRNTADSTPPQVKSLNYLNNIMAKLEANRAGAAEAIFLNHQSNVVEATADNLFIIREGVVYTPPISDGALPGINREVVIELAPKIGLECKETHITLYDLYSADECLLTGTAARVVPVTTIDGRSIGDGLPGPVTKRIMEACTELCCTDGVNVFSEAAV